MGVAALFQSVVDGLAHRLRFEDLHVFDYARGVRHAEVRAGGRTARFRVSGANLSRRLHSPDSLAKIALSARLGGLWNPGARALLGADALLDISGGDSFTDLYGAWRYKSVAGPKHIALNRGKPLILLPQTYGPYQSSRVYRDAERIVRGSRAAWARDEKSFQVLLELLGPHFDPARHRCGVDVAFGLEPAQPPLDGREVGANWLLGGGEGLLLGFNVSGLIYNDPDAARRTFRLRADYRRAVESFLRRVLERSDSRVLLVPHVLAPPGSVESDPAASEALAESLRARYPGRVAVAPRPSGPGEAKWLISRCGWFCGTRMHATIAALSSGVPTAAISYSPKTLGVFETCGQGEHVADPSVLDTEELVEHLWRSLEGRDRARVGLAARLPHVLRAADEQMDLVAAECVRLAEHRRDSAA